MLKKCLTCKKLFYKKSSESKLYWQTKKYCSYNCKIKSQLGKKNTSILKKCTICPSNFWISPSEIKNNRGKYCSRKCAAIGKTGKARPDMIGNKFRVGRRAWNKGKQWSLEIKNKLSTAHQNPSAEIREKLSKARKGKKASPTTRIKQSLAQRGAKGSNWQGGITPVNHIIRTSFEYKQWAKAVKVRDNFECQICGAKGVFLHSNHIKKFCDYPELRFKLTNGIVICRDCDYKWVQQHKEEWESYFNFNLKTRGFIEDEFIPRKILW